MDLDSELVPMKCLPQYQAFAKLFFRACAIFKAFLNCGHLCLTVTMALLLIKFPPISTARNTSYPVIIVGSHKSLNTFMLYLIPGGESSVL